MIGDPELSIVEELIGIIEQSVIVIRLVLNQSIYGVQPAEVEQELRQDDPVRVLAARLTHVINHAKSSAEEDVTDNGDGADVTSEDTDSVICLGNSVQSIRASAADREGNFQGTRSANES